MNSAKFFVRSQEFFKAQNALYTLCPYHGSTDKIDIEVWFLDMTTFGENGPKWKLQYVQRSGKYALFK